MSPLTWKIKGYEKVHDKAVYVQCRDNCLSCTLNMTHMGMNAIQNCHQPLPSVDMIITSIVDTSAMRAFSSTCVYYTPKLPLAKRMGRHAMRLDWSIASEVHTLPAKLLTITQLLSPTQLLQPNVQCSWHQHCHDTYASGEIIQAVHMLTNDLRMQTRSLAEWEPMWRIVLQACKHINFALLGLLIPCAVTIALQAIQVVTLASVLQFALKLTKAVSR